jgi:hypothetical protein
MFRETTLFMEFFTYMERTFFDMIYLVSKGKAWNSTQKKKKSPNPLISGDSGLICGA